MRAAEARITLGIAAARSGDLDTAVDEGHKAFEGERHSVPTLVSVGGELAQVLRDRYVLSRITLPGSIYLGMIAVLPNLFLQIGATGGVQNIPFGGTAVLIMIGVGLDTVIQIESQLMQRNYEGFLK